MQVIEYRVIFHPCCKTASIEIKRLIHVMYTLKEKKKAENQSSGVITLYARLCTVIYLCTVTYRAEEARLIINLVYESTRVKISMRLRRGGFERKRDGLARVY